jgi:hypothetical protein
MEHWFHAHACLPTCHSGNSLVPGTVWSHSGSQCCVSPSSCQSWSLCGSTGMTPGGHCNRGRTWSFTWFYSFTFSEILFYLTFQLDGHAMAQAVSCGPVIVVVIVYSQASPRRICSGQSGTETGFSLSTSASCVSILSDVCVSPVHDTAGHWTWTCSEQRFPYYDGWHWNHSD